MQLHADLNSLSQSIERHRPEVHNYLGNRLGCMDTAADLFQTIVEHLLKRDPDPPIENVRAYLFQAARHALASHHRSESVRRRYQESEEPLADSLDERDPGRIVDAEQSVVRLEAALSELPLLTRKMFLLYRLQGVKQEDIAKQFDVHLSTVQKRLRKAALHCQSRLYE